MKPLISIIIIAYNIERYIKQSLLSCINQTYSNVEIICIDDCSNDQTYKIIADLKKKLKTENIIFYKQPYNNGPNSARKKGIDIATGDYLFFLDGDDYIPINALECLVKELYNDNYDIVFGNTQVFVGDKYENHISKYDVDKGMSGINYLSRFLHKQHSIWGKLIKRSLFINNKLNYLEDLRIGEDLGLMVQLLYNATKISYTDKITYYYRGKRADSLTQKYSYSNKELATIPAASFVCDYLYNHKALYNTDYFTFFHRYFYAYISSNNPPITLKNHIKNIIKKTSILYQEKDKFTHYLHYFSNINLYLGHLFYKIYTNIYYKCKRN